MPVEQNSNLLNHDQAIAEASLVKEQAPHIKNQLVNLAHKTEDEASLKMLGEMQLDAPALLDQTQKYIDALESQNPALYNALISQKGARLSLETGLGQGKANSLINESLSGIDKAIQSDTKTSGTVQFFSAMGVALNSVLENQKFSDLATKPELFGELTKYCIATNMVTVANK